MLIEKIKEQIMKCEGVTSGVHRFGGIEFRIGNREMGHVHGDKLADLPFPMNIRNKLIESGRASPHHILPHSGWVSKWINGEDDIADVIELFRMQYERLKPHDKQNDVL
jgi:Luciferase